MNRPIWWEALAALAALVTVLVFVSGESKLSDLVGRLIGQKQVEVSSSARVRDLEKQAQEERAKRELLEREAAANRAAEERAHHAEAERTAEERARREQLEKEITASRAGEAERARTAEAESRAREERAKRELLEQELAARRVQEGGPTIRQERVSEPMPTLLPSERGKPNLTVLNMTAQHNVDVAGQPGMAIRVQLNARDLQGRHLYVAAYFFFGSGSPLKDLDGSYRSQNGQVSTGIPFVPPEQQTRTTLTLEVPYAELHVAPNVHSNLEYRVLIFDHDSVEGQTVLYESGPRHFYLN